MHVTRAVLPVMRRIAGLKGGALSSLYCSSKFALECWSESLAAEMLPFGIQVTAIEPRFFRTDFLDVSSARYTEVKNPQYQAGLEHLRTWLDGKSHQQGGDPAKLANVLLDLATKDQQPLHLLMGNTPSSGWRTESAVIRQIPRNGEAYRNRRTSCQNRVEE
jgi:NAD(P)-dependent dehydrogenase (short-subunit alcohol dehydrogenase family)